jgi:hypothetical protein
MIFPYRRCPPPPLTQFVFISPQLSAKGGRVPRICLILAHLCSLVCPRFRTPLGFRAPHPFPGHTSLPRYSSHPLDFFVERIIIP